MQKQNFYKREKGRKEGKTSFPFYFPFLQQVTDYLAISKDISQWFSIFGH